MTLVEEFRDAKQGEDLLRLRRLLALRAMVASKTSQREIANNLGISQPAVSQQLKGSTELLKASPERLLKAATPILKTLALEHGYSKLAVFGSTARGESHSDSDLDLLVEAPAGASTFDFVRFQHLFEEVLGRKIDLVSYGGLKPGIDNDILRDAVPL